MTGNQLFESMQYLDDALVEEYEARPADRTVWLRRAAAAAAVVVIAGAVLALPRLKQPEPGGVSGTEVYWTQPPQKTQGEPQRVGVPGPNAATAVSKPAGLAWNDLDETRKGIETDVAGVAMVSEPLTKAQAAACSPEIREEWMAQFNGYAAYYLKDGAGGLAYIELSVVNAAWGGTCTVHIKDSNAPDPADCFVVAPLATDRVEALGGQEYRAYRYTYYHGEGDPKLYPPEAWAELSVVFEKENVAYTLRANVPAAQAELAEADLRDLLLCYAGTHSIPDLSAFRCGEHLYRDEELTFAEALADPDFGACLPESGPEGFELTQMRRYQLEDTVNYLLAFWFRQGGELVWQIKPADAQDLARVVDPERPETYDWNRYPVPWSAYAAQENWLTIENPVFRIGDLTPELIAARVHTGDEGTPMCRFGVLFDSGILVEINAKDVSAAWIYETLMHRKG